MNKETLVAEINRHNTLYWMENEPEISDVEYDKLVKQLRDIDPENPVLQKFESPKMNSTKKVKHKKPMLSLDKVYGEEELFSWVRKRARSSEEKYVIQPKFDGISAKLEDGILSTRGDGEEGEDITDRLPLVDIFTSRSLYPGKIRNPEIPLYGELVIKNTEFKEVFPKYKTRSGNPFKNSRNAIAGIMGCDEVSFYADQGLKVTLIDYDIYSNVVSAEDFETEWPKISAKIKTLNYPLDGIVIKLCDQVYAESLGATSHHPRSAIAFKFENQTRTTKIIGYEISQGKESLSAIALLEPVDFDGITGRRCRIPLTKNQERPELPFIMNGGIAIGDIIVIERSGDVIPNVVSITPGENRTVIELKECPFCNSSLDINETSVRCQNANCLEKIVNKIEFSLKTLGFLGIGKSILKKIIQETEIQDVGEFMKLNERMLVATGIGPGHSKNIANEIQRIRKNKGASVLTALNVPSLGNSASTILLQRYSMYEILQGIPYEELINLSGIGEVTAREISEYIAANKDRLQSIVTNFEFEEEATPRIYHSTICFTGKMRAARSEMEKLADEHNFKVVDSVSKNLDFLVVGENAGSKLEKAKKLGKTIYTEEEFFTNMKEIEERTK